MIKTTSLEIALIDLSREFRFLKDEVMPKIEDVISGARFILDRELQEFEQNFASYCGTKHCLGMSSGTTALTLALKACGIGPGDEVVTTPFTFTATAEAIALTGATPVFCDIDRNTLLIDTNKVGALIGPNTKAILPVHLYGAIGEIETLQSLCKKHGLFLIEDCAQAHGARRNGSRSGSFGDIGCFSFMPAKNLGAYGDGGCIVTNNTELFTQLKMLRDHGRITKYEHHKVGLSGRLDNLHAAVLNIKLKYLDIWNEKRREICAAYMKGLVNDIFRHVRVPINSESSRYVFTVLVKHNRGKLASGLNSRGIATGVYYPTPLHLQKAYSYLNYREGLLPVAESAALQVLSLPLFPFLTPEETDYIVSIANSVATDIKC